MAERARAPQRYHGLFVSSNTTTFGGRSHCFTCSTRAKAHRFRHRPSIITMSGVCLKAETAPTYASLSSRSQTWTWPSTFFLTCSAHQGSCSTETTVQPRSENQRVEAPAPHSNTVKPSLTNSLKMARACVVTQGSQPGRRGGRLRSRAHWNMPSSSGSVRMRRASRRLRGLARRQRRRIRSARFAILRRFVRLGPFLRASSRCIGGERTL
ncbi:hypothetical protein HRbin33_01925 [bacterium HR33]|nr:hypothetical protein HRbin33_01925 [bacterium HR33]